MANSSSRNGQSLAASIQAIKAFCDEFVCRPFMHRTEHSIHMQVAEMLSAHPSLRKPLALKIDNIDFQDKVWSVSRVQKEWPTIREFPSNPLNLGWYDEPSATANYGESEARTKAGRRGNYDLAILPSNAGITHWNRYYEGHEPKPEVVIEIGLDYHAEVHLKNDLLKFQNSGNQCDGLFLHLFRSMPRVLDREIAVINRLSQEFGLNQVVLNRAVVGQTPEAESSSIAFLGHIGSGSIDVVDSK